MMMSPKGVPRPNFCNVLRLLSVQALLTYRIPCLITYKYRNVLYRNLSNQADNATKIYSATLHK